MPVSLRQKRIRRIVNFPATITTNGESYIQVRTLAAGQNVITLSSGDLALTGFQLIIKDESGNANLSNYIEVITQGEKIDGADRAFINAPYGSIALVSDGSNWAITKAPNRTTLMMAVDTTTQPAAAVVGNVVNVKFGPSQGGILDMVEWDDFVNQFTFNDKGRYRNHFIMRVYRTNSTMVEAVEFKVLINGVVANQFATEYVQLDSTVTDERLEMVIEDYFNEGDTLQMQMGTALIQAATDIGLDVITSVIAGWDDIPSACNEIMRIP